VYFNSTVKINNPNRNKNIQYRWEESTKYGYELDLSKIYTFNWSYCNSNNDDFEKKEEKWEDYWIYDNI
jgi:hypothetical protein